MQLAAASVINPDEINSAPASAILISVFIKGSPVA
jgi:hypothetical protein